MLNNNKIAIVTGGAAGIGYGIAKVLLADGAKVIIADVNEEKGQVACAELTADGGECHFVRCNIANKDDVNAMFKYALDSYGRIDVIVNNAGINRDGTLHKMTDEAWDLVVDVNLKGTFYCMREAAVIMRNQESGRIINISSASWLGNFGQSNYAASKAGVIGLTKTATRELAKKGVTINAICPGFIETEMTRGVSDKVWDLMISKIPAGYAGDIEDVGQCVSFLASDRARYINGEVINVGGGMVL